MTNIYINGEKFKVYIYDTQKTIIERYAMQKEGALPEYFYVDGAINKEKGSKNEIEDIRVVIENIKEKSLADEDLIRDLMRKYNVKKSQIGILWLLRDGFNIEDLDLRKLEYLNEKGVFNTTKRVELTLKDYIVNLERKRKLLKQSIDQKLKVFKSLDELEAIQTTSFILEDIFLSLNVSISENMIELFDSIDATTITPYIELSYQNKKYYKIYTEMTPPLEWLNEDVNLPKDYIYMKILNTKSTNLQDAKNLGKIYSQCMVFASGTGTDNQYVIDTNFQVSSNFNQENFVKRISSIFEKKVKYQITNVKQNSIRGIFRTQEFNFDPVIFSDFLSTDETSAQIFYLDERLQTVLSKNKFYFYYNLEGIRDTRDSLGISVTKDDKLNAVQFRITRALNEEQANILKLILARILSLYNEKHDEIASKYLKLFPKEVSKFQKPVKTRVKKTKLRLDRLYNERPDLIRREGYSTQCQKPSQPYIVPAEDVKKVGKELKDPHKLILFEGSWFACEPREDNDPKAAANYIWPGLQKNSRGAAQYQKEVPYIPCCFKKDQYIKANSPWRKYYDALGKEGSDLARQEEPVEKSGMGYIVGIKKMCEDGRKGEMPFLWEKILHIIGIEKVSLGKFAKTDKDFYPVLRLGMPHKPDSILYCLEHAFNRKFQTLSTEKKIEAISTVRRELSQQDFSVAKQSLFYETDEDIRDVLLDENAYIDPLKYIELLERMYKCNIFLYGYDADLFPDGEIMIPKHIHAYLAKEINEDLPTVLILLYASKFYEYEYQCELICQIDVQDNKEIKKNIKYTFSPKSKITKIAAKLFYDHYEVLQVHTDQYTIYRPIDSP